MILKLFIVLSILLSACSPSYQRYQKEITGLFDTIIIITGYEKSHARFNNHTSIIVDELNRLHKLFDIHNSYHHINNLKTINDNAGISPIKVDEDIIHLLSLSQAAYYESNGTINVGMGSILRIWARYHENSQSTKLPDITELRAAAKHTNIDDMVIDYENSTVFLTNPYMSLDVGALAKGFAVQRAMDLAKASGFTSAIINAGGDMSIVGVPMSSREHWAVGIKSPHAGASQSLLFDTILIDRNISVAVSGGYERFFIVDDKTYGHIIDPKTLMPANRFAATVALHPDFTMSEMLSTAIFILPYEEGLELIIHHNADALWINHDGTSMATDGYMILSQSKKGL